MAIIEKKPENIALDEKFDKNIRPENFDSFIGQEDFKNRIKISIQACKERKDPLGSLCLNGFPGGGKTTLASVIAREYGSPIKCINSSAIKTIGDLIEILSKLEKNSFLFLDEAHALNKQTQTSLLSAIEDFKISIKLLNKQILNIDIKPFTLIAATTEVGKLLPPFVDRFDVVYTLEPYNVEEIFKIIKKNIERLKLQIQNDEVILNMAKRSRGVPRIANRIIRRVRDYGQVKNNNIITNNIVNEAMELEGVDENGLTNLDINYLKVLYDVFGTGPAGLSALAASVGEDESTIENFVETFLLLKGLIARTPRGRILTKDGINMILNNK